MGVFLHVAANAAVPAKLLEQIFKANPGGASCTFISDGVPQHMNMEGQYTLDNLAAMLELLKPHPAWFHFMSNPPASPEDYQPYPVLKEAGAPMILLMGDGDFSNSEKTDGTHSGVFYNTYDYLMPELAELWTKTGKDIKKMASTINTDMWDRRIRNSFISGALVLFYAHGEYKRFAKGDGTTFSWGWTTNAYDYKESEYPDKSVVDKTQSVIDKLKSALKGPTSNIKDKPATAIPAGGKTNDQLIADTTVQEYEYKYLPTHFMTEVARRQWYKNVMNEKNNPDGVEVVVSTIGNTQTIKRMKYGDLTRSMIMEGKGVALRFPEKKKVVKLEDLGTALDKSTPAAAEKQLVAGTKGKDTAPHHIPAPKTTPASVPGQVTTEVLPVLSEKQQRSLDTLFARQDVKTMLDLSARKMPFDPKKLQGEENKFQTFAQSRGLKDTRMLAHLSLRALWDMGKIDPLALAILCSDWRALAMQYAPAYEEPKAKSPAELFKERQAARAAGKAS